MDGLVKEVTFTAARQYFQVLHNDWRLAYFGSRLANWSPSAQIRCLFQLELFITSCFLGRMCHSRDYVDATFVHEPPHRVICCDSQFQFQNFRVPVFLKLTDSTSRAKLAITIITLYNHRYGNFACPRYHISIIFDRGYQ